MSTTFDDDERSISSSRPIDLYEIRTPTVTYRLTSYVLDVTYAGQTYTATTMSRGSQEVTPNPVGREFLIYLPITHPLVQRYASSGIPEHDVAITVVRLQAASGVAAQSWSGFGGALKVEGRMVTLAVPSITDDAIRVQLPVVAAQHACNHVLFDKQCQKVRGDFTDTVTITSINGNSISIGGVLRPLDYYAFGAVKHVATKQLRMIVSQDGSVITLNVPFVGANVGDAIDVSSGCDHSLRTCRDKFDNVINFGGHPYINGQVDPWAQGGLGIVVQF